MMRIYKYVKAAESEIFDRNEPLARVEKTVADIIADVKRNGDAALRKYTKQFDRADLQSMEVTRD